MKIISEFKDYYDYASSYGIDTSVTYVRKQDQLKIPITSLQEYPVHYVPTLKEHKYFQPFLDATINVSYLTKNKITRFITWDTVVLYMCGKLFMPYNYRTYDRLNIKQDHYTDNKELAIIKQLEVDAKRCSSKVYRPSFKKHEDFNNKHIDLGYELGRQFNSPLLVIKFDRNYLSVTTNPRLIDYNCISSNPTILYQEILSFLLTSNEPDVIMISDKDLRDSKGFDNQSFKHRK